jgi:hypothetical protein
MLLLAVVSLGLRARPGERRPVDRLQQSGAAA